MADVTGTREVYRNPPAALVAVEVRHTTSADLTSEEEAKVKALVGDVFPLAQPLQSGLVFSVGFPNPGGPGVPPAPPRYTNRERTIAVTFAPQLLLLETTQHESFTALNALLGLVVSARQEVAPVDGLERLGLRYIDEIRVPDSEPIEWSKWVHSSLVGPAAVGEEAGLTLVEHQALARFRVSDSHSLNLAYGPRVGYAVADKPLVRTLPPAGPFFLLDIDSSWTAQDTIPEFDPSGITRQCEELHEPVNALFEALITDNLREQILRHA
jgi:uncharacterized protein (TIGR04255 family)